jgi:tetratricopeptide (TPR) repeat protein
MAHDPGLQAGLLEKEAHALLAREKFEEAYAAFKKAGEIYKESGCPKEAAFCLASAASCWAIRSGEKLFHNASKTYREAARESELAGDWEYASLLYRQAAINFERDMEFLSFSECFYNSRECLRKFMTRSLFMPQKNHPASILGTHGEAPPHIFKRLWLCCALNLSALIWGHGEKPGRTFGLAVFLVIFSSFFYMHGHLVRGELIFRPDFLQSLYFSVVTFTTVGYGDVSPVGATRLMAMLEAFSSLFIIPMFLVGLSRKYLRT